MWATTADASPASARGTATEFPTDAGRSPAGAGRDVSVLPFHSSAGRKEGLEVVRRICRKRQCGVDLPELRKDVLIAPEYWPYLRHAGLRKAKTAMG